MARFVLLLALLFLTASVFGKDVEPLVSIRQDFAGAGAHTKELMLMPDGTVREEQ